MQTRMRTRAPRIPTVHDPPSTEWNSEAFIARAAAASSSPHQLARFKKLYEDPFYLYEMRATPQSPHTVATMTMSGSQQHLYNMVVKRSGHVTCSCFDSSIHGGLACKHVCFFVYRVVKLLDNLSFMSLGANGTLSASDLEAVQRHADSRATDWTENGSISGVIREGDEIDRIIMANQTHQTHPVLPREFVMMERPLTEDSECPVCYCAFDESNGDFLGCPTCGNPVHTECARRWLAMAPHATCIMCRSNKWEELKSHFF